MRRRMGRRRLIPILLNAATVASLVLAALTVVLWVSGNWISVRARYGRAPGLFVFSSGGGLYALYQPTPRNQSKSWGFGIDGADDLAPESDLFGVPENRWLPVRLFRAGGPRASVRMVLLSDWFVLSVSGCIAAWGVSRWRKARKSNGNEMCSTCGYDLRATPDRCPECGAVPGPPA